MMIKGLGLKKYESYGEVFLKVITDYCIKNGVSSIISRDEKIVREDLVDRYKSTYNCYQEGLSLEEISKTRNFTINTIIEHLSKCEEQGQTVNWSRFLTPIKEEKILEVINRIGFERLKPIKELLPEEFTYEDIKVVIAKNGLK